MFAPRRLFQINPACCIDTMAPGKTWLVLLVEDNENLAKNVKELLETSDLGEVGQVSVTLETSFELAQEALTDRRFDVVVLDVFRGEPRSGGDQAGRQVLDTLRGIRFAPVIFYTASQGS